MLLSQHIISVQEMLQCVNNQRTEQQPVERRGYVARQCYGRHRGETVVETGCHWSRADDAWLGPGGGAPQGGGPCRAIIDALCSHGRRFWMAAPPSAGTQPHYHGSHSTRIRLNQQHTPVCVKGGICFIFKGCPPTNHCSGPKIFLIRGEEGEKKGIYNGVTGVQV